MFVAGTSVFRAKRRPRGDGGVGPSRFVGPMPGRPPRLLGGQCLAYLSGVSQSNPMATRGGRSAAKFQTVIKCSSVLMASREPWASKAR